MEGAFTPDHPPAANITPLPVRVAPTRRADQNVHAVDVPLLVSDRLAANQQTRGQLVEGAHLRTRCGMRVGVGGIVGRW